MESKEWDIPVSVTFFPGPVPRVYGVDALTTVYFPDPRRPSWDRIGVDLGVGASVAYVDGEGTGSLGRENSR